MARERAGKEKGGRSADGREIGGGKVEGEENLLLLLLLRASLPFPPQSNNSCGGLAVLLGRWVPKEPELEMKGEGGRGGRLHQGKEES